MEQVMTQVPEGYKRCSTCKVVKLIRNTDGSMNFSSRKASKDGLAYSCKDCERKCAGKSYKTKKRKIREKKYYQENRDHLLELSAKNYQDNRDTRLAQSKEYRQSNPEVSRAAGRVRRQRIKNQKGTPYTREEVIAEATVNGVIICAICRLAVHPNEVHIDHIKPIADGGLDCKTNVRVTHRKCNIQRPKDGRDLTK